MVSRKKLNSRRRAGFTLMEMLIVVAIIIALAGVGGYYLMGALSSSKEGIAEAQVRGTLSTACMSYAIKHNDQFPDQLQQLLVKDATGGPYLDNPDALMDPWNQPYQYDKSGQMNNGMKPDIWTTDPKDPQRKKIGNWSKNLQK